MTGSLATTLFRPVLGLAILAGVGLLAPYARASCGDYLQNGPSPHASPGMAVAKEDVKPILPDHLEKSGDKLPCSGPRCGRQPAQLPVPVAPPSAGTHADQWALPVAQSLDPSAGNDRQFLEECSQAFSAHPYRIERPPRCV